MKNGDSYEECLTFSEKVRIGIVPMLWFAYSVALFFRLDQFYQNWVFIIVYVVWFLIAFLATQCVIGMVSVAYFDKFIFRQTWCNIPMLVYIITILGPYCVLMYNAYKPVDMIAVKDVRTADFIVLQAVMPVLMIGSMLYPLPKRKLKIAETAAAIVGSLHAFDIMDVATNLKFIQHFGNSVHALFYISFILSIMLLAFPIGLDEDDDEDPQRGRIIKTILTLVFTETSFCIIRVLVMHEENSLSGLVFASKNALSAIYHIYLIVKAVAVCRCNYRHKYSRV